jgi:two-component system, OmpR family, sensor histidine kinase SenX3
MAWLAAAAVVALLGVLAAWVANRRTVRRRVEAAVARLEAEPTLPEGRAGLTSLLARLERAVDDRVAALEGERAAHRRLALGLEAVPQGVVLADEEGREVFRNEMATAFAGARHAEALVQQAIEEQLHEAVLGTPQRRNLDLFGPPRRMLVISAVPIEGGAVAIIDDVSERRRLEAVRRDFVANISHELKTPVGALGLLAETIVTEDEPAVVRRLAERMTGEALRVGRIIDDLLALTRIEAEEHPLREPVGVRAVVDEAADRVRSLAESCGIGLETAGVGARHTVRGDRRQLVSAVANLLENACKYSDGGSVEVSSSSDGSWVEIAVVDHGIGIPARDLDRVFERFYRVDRARSRQTGGTGLGLAIVRHVAANHRGEVRVESEEGVGSTFTLRLPAGPGPVAVSPHSEAS